MTIQVDPLKSFEHSSRLYCNVNNKNGLSFTCFSENDILELVTIYNSDIATKNGKRNHKDETYPLISIYENKLTKKKNLLKQFIMN